MMANEDKSILTVRRGRFCGECPERKEGSSPGHSTQSRKSPGFVLYAPESQILEAQRSQVFVPVIAVHIFNNHTHT